MKRKEILEQAIKCVCGDREQDYGTPENNFQTISELWTDYINGKYRKIIVFKPKDVAIMMALLKIARIASGTDKEDSFVDACGYMACAGECADDR